MPIATWQVEGLDQDGAPQPPMMGCHQPSERFKGTVIPFAWFAQGLRILDIADPYRAAGGRFLRARRAGGLRACLFQRRDDRRPRADLPDRPPARRRHHRNLRVRETSMSSDDKDIHDHRQEEPEPAVPSGGAGRRLHLRLRARSPRTRTATCAPAISRRRRAGPSRRIRRILAEDGADLSRCRAQ